MLSPSRKEKKPKNWKDPHCSARWYEEKFAPMYEAYAGQPALFGPKEMGCHANLFKRLRKLNIRAPLSDEQLYERATMCTEYIFKSQAEGVEYGWLTNPPDISVVLARIADLNISVNRLLNLTEVEIVEQQKQDKLFARFKAIDKEFEKHGGNITQTIGALQSSNRLSNPNTKGKKPGRDIGENVSAL